MSAADAEEQVYQQVFSVDSASGEWENGLLAFTGNFDRVERIDIFPIFSQNQQRARIKRVAVDYVQPFEITSDDILGNPKGELLEKCSKVVYNAVSFSTTSQTPDEPVSTVTVSPNVLTEVKNSDIYYNQRFESENSGVTISEEEHYAYCSFLKISGASNPAEIQWFANVVEEMPEVPYESDIGDLGEVCEFNNPIASNAESRQDVADWMADYLSKRRQYTVETLGYPEVDPGDLILYNGQQVTVTEANISFQQGAMKETFTLRGETKIGNMANT